MQNRVSSADSGNLSRLGSSFPAFWVCLFTVTLVGCARHHTYIDSNGNVTTVGHQPFWGPSKVNQDTVVMSNLPTQVQGGKVISAPVQSQNTLVAGGVSNSTIPEAVVVQHPGNLGVPSPGEPGLSDTGVASGAPATQVSGGISSANTPNRK